jgi:hypothetical protein
MKGESSVMAECKYDFDYFINRIKETGWGKTNEDDKYWEDHELMDSFAVFYVYAFAHLNLPAPTQSQLELARFISDTSNPHRMLMAMRGLA